MEFHAVFVGEWPPALTLLCTLLDYRILRYIRYIVVRIKEWRKEFTEPIGLETYRLVVRTGFRAANLRVASAQSYVRTLRQFRQ